MNRRKSTLSNSSDPPALTRTNSRQNGNFTLEQRAKIIDFRDKNPGLTQVEIAHWTRTEFNLSEVPSKSCISKIIKKKRDVSSLDEMDRNTRKKKSTRSAALPELEEYLYNLVVEHQNTSVGISGPALIFYGISYCTHTLKLPPEQIPSFSNGWFQGFKARHGLHGFKMHGEAGSLLRVNMDVVEREMRDVKVRLSSFDPSDVFNFDETALYYARSPVRTISSQPVAGVKLDKKRLTVGLLCSSDGTFRMDPCIIGQFQKPACFQKKTDNLLNK